MTDQAQPGPARGVVDIMAALEQSVAEAKAARERKVERATLPEPLSVFEARYDGRCAGCDEPIAKGDLIGWHPDFLTRHHDCWDAA